MIGIEEIKSITQIKDLELYNSMVDAIESPNELYIAYGWFHNNEFPETRHGLVKNGAPEGIIMCWKDNPFEMNEEYDLVLRI